MAFSHGTAARMWLDGFGAACYLTEFSLEIETDDAETTTLCNTAKTFIPGLEEGTVEWEGLFDTDTVSPTATLSYLLDARRRVTFPVVYAPSGALNLSDPAYLMNGFLTDYTVETTVDEAATVEAEMMVTNKAHRGLIVIPDGAYTTSDDGSSIDNGVATVNGGAAVLSVSSVSGTTPTLDVKLQHSVDDSVWVDLTPSFSTQNSVNAEYIEITGTIQRYVRAVYTVGGGTPSFTFNVAFSRR